MADDFDSSATNDVRPTLRLSRHGPGDELLGRYVIESVLGRGAMGVVYGCIDRNGGNKVAVKAISPDYAGREGAMETVRSNFRMVSELSHPNIAAYRTLEHETGTGDNYLVMSRAFGIGLGRWMREHAGRADRERQFAILRQIAAALDYAHGAVPTAVIHRDVKPGNVMVGDGDVVKVLDFGLAEPLGASPDGEDIIVADASGTPSYQSPEQWQSLSQGARSDQYSLGVIAYEMLAGARPYSASDMESLKLAVTTTPVPPISQESNAVNAVLAKVLAKNPEDRFDSCGAFVEALVQADRQPLSDAGAAAIPMSRRRRRVGIAAGLAALALGVWWLVGGRDNQDRQRVEPMVKPDTQLRMNPPSPSVTIPASQPTVRQLPKPTVRQVPEPLRGARLCWDSKDWEGCCDFCTEMLKEDPDCEEAKMLLQKAKAKMESSQKENDGVDD